MRVCPFCGEQVQENDIKCRYCGEFISDEFDQNIPNESELRDKRRRLRDRSSFSFDDSAKDELRKSIEKSSIGEEITSQATMLLAFFLLLIPPLFIISYVIMKWEYSQLVNHWVETGTQKKKTNLYHINIVLIAIWGWILTLVFLLFALSVAGLINLLK